MKPVPLVCIDATRSRPAPKPTPERVKGKTCVKWTRVLPLTEFAKHARAKDGRQKKCRQCAGR
jgi:hypothetical protein